MLLPSDAHEARTLREKFTKIGLRALAELTPSILLVIPSALYWFMIDGLMDLAALTIYSGGWW